MFTSIVRDLRYALRSLGRNPGFACVSVLALALGIGANSAIFTVVSSVLLQPLRFQRPEQLVVVRERNLKAGFPQFSLSPGNYLGYRDQNHTFSGIAAFGRQGFNLAGGGEPERLIGTRVTPNFFDVLGRKPSMGRSFTAQETQLGRHRVAILSHGLWQRRFAGSREVLGQTLKLNDELYTRDGDRLLGTGRFLASQLFEVKPTDPATYAAVAGVLLATAMLACAIPALRAMRVDPLVALRNE